MPSTIEKIRTAGEKQLGKVLSKLSKKHREKVRKAIKKYGSVRDIPLTFWNELQKEIDQEAAKILFFIMLASWDSTEDDLQLPRFMTALQRELQAEQVAHAQAMELARVSIINTLTKLQRIEDRLKEKAELTAAEAAQELDTSVDDVISTQRADTSAVTETTRAISSGQLKGRDEYQKRFPDRLLSIKWITERDEKVCPICRPLDQTPEPVWTALFPTGPPAHPICRCELLVTRTRGQKFIGRLEELGRKGVLRP